MSHPTSKDVKPVGEGAHPDDAGQLEAQVVACEGGQHKHASHKDAPGSHTPDPQYACVDLHRRRNPFCPTQGPSGNKETRLSFCRHIGNSGDALLLHGRIA